MTGIPDPLDLIAVRDPQGTPWLALASHPGWKQQIAPETEALGIPGARHGCTSPRTSFPVIGGSALRNWARGKDWFGRWMPEAPEIPNVLLGAYPDDPQWSAADGSIEWWDAAGGPMPGNLLQCAAWYGGTGTSRDASAEAETTGWVPSRRLHDVLGLSEGADFSWRDASVSPSTIPRSYRAARQLWRCDATWCRDSRMPD